MDQEKIVTDKINDLMGVINERHPELLKYISEMTIANPDEKDPEISKKNLYEYYNSLLEMLKKYNHPIPEEHEK